MRKLLALVLVSYLTTFWAPFVVMASHGPDQLEEESDCDYDGSNCPPLGEEEESDTSSTTTDPVVESTDEELKNAIEAPLMCPISLAVNYGDYSTADKKKVYQDWYETEYNYEIGLAFAESKASSDIQCGTANSYSKFLEKGDCTAEGLVVTEITEVFAPNTKLGDDSKNQIITTYAGLCCAAGEKYGDKVLTCDDTRTIYTTTYTDCTKVAVNCEKRQWVIGNSGIGIVQLMIKQIYIFGAFAVGSIAVSTMIFQGIKISVSGVSGDISEAKNKILQALSGIVLLFLSGLILYTINPDFFG